MCRDVDADPRDVARPDIGEVLRSVSPDKSNPRQVDSFDNPGKQDIEMEIKTEPASSTQLNWKPEPLPEDTTAGEINEPTLVEDTISSDEGKTNYPTSTNILVSTDAAFSSPGRETLPSYEDNASQALCVTENTNETGTVSDTLSEKRLDSVPHSQLLSNDGPGGTTEPKPTTSSPLTNNAGEDEGNEINDTASQHSDHDCISESSPKCSKDSAPFEESSMRVAVQQSVSIEEALVCVEQFIKSR